MGTKRRAPAVAIVVENLPVPLDRRVWCEALALRDAGWKVSVIAHRAVGEPMHETLDGIEVCRYPAPPDASGPISYALEFAWCLAATAFWCAVLLARRELDVLHACNPPDTFFALGRLLRVFGVRFVYDQHDLCPELFGVKYAGRPRGARLLRVLSWMERASYHTADVVIAPNESYAEVARRRGSVPADRVFVVRSAPPRDRFVRTKPSLRWKNGHRQLVGYIGVMGSQDGVDGLLRAAHELVHVRGRRDVGFVLIGAGDELPALRALARTLDLERHVEFTGRISDLTEISEALGSADVCVCPDPKNAFNDVSSMNKIVEYMALGQPIVGFALTESARTAGDGGLWIEEPSSRALAGGIAQLLDDPARCMKMGKANRERFLASLTWEAQAPQLVAAYRTLVRFPAQIAERRVGAARVEPVASKSGRAS